jgi:hypothetical protein
VIASGDSNQAGSSWKPMTISPEFHKNHPDVRFIHQPNLDLLFLMITQNYAKNAAQRRRRK